MDFSLRLLTEDDIPALQAAYDSVPELFTGLLGRPAAPDQAAADFLQALLEPTRYQFGITLDGHFIGLIDCKLSEEEAGRAHIGLLLLTAPYDDPAIAGMVLRILVRWLVENFGVRHLSTDVPAHLPGEVAFWEAQGFQYTGAQYRREFVNYAPRFLVMVRDLDAGSHQRTDNA